MAEQTAPGAGEAGALREIRRLARLWYGAEPWTAWGLTLAALALTLAAIAVEWGFAQWHRGAFDALEARDAQGFLGQMGVFAGLIGMSMAVSVGRLWSRQVIAFRWRRWLVLKLQGALLADGRHYHMAVSGQAVDAPDQRIGENTRWATVMAVDLALGLLHAVVLFATFAGLLWHLSDGFALPLGGGAYLAVPGGLLWAACLYAGLCAFVTWRVGRRMPAIHSDRNRAEAAHRFALLRVGEHSEAIALIRGEADEARGLAGAYGRVEAAMLRLLRSERQLMWLGSSYIAIAGVLPLLLCSPRYFAGAITLGVMMQTGHAFVEVTRALTWFVDTWPRLADWRTHVARVVELERACTAPAPTPGGIRLSEAPEERLEVRNLALGTACGRALVAEAALELRPGERLLITGESGCGKSTLFRAIAGLWPWGEGGIRAPLRERSMFLPQRPYLPLGTLAAALCYPLPPDAFPAEAQRAALERCRLPALAPRLGEVARWDRVLSLGEQQRIAFARLLLHRPRWVFMDEATSALDEANQAVLFRLLAEELPDAALLSIGHRPGLAAYHDRVLLLAPGPGGARLVEPRALGLAGWAGAGGPATPRRALKSRLARPSVG
jgi:putative ATP-binding cassette transporter